MKIEATLQQLALYHQHGWWCWLTPGGSPYWDSRPRWFHDRVVAKPLDFAVEQGWTDFGWDDIPSDFDGWDDVLAIEINE